MMYTSQLHQFVVHKNINFMFLSTFFMSIYDARLYQRLNLQHKVIDSAILYIFCIKTIVHLLTFMIFVVCLPFAFSISKMTVE